MASAVVKAQKAVKKILDLLPFDGSKVKIGVIFSIVGLIRFGIPGVDLWDVTIAILENPTRAGIITVLLGVLHKALKTKFPDVKI